MFTLYDVAYMFLMVQGLGLGLGLILSMIYHWPNWS